MLTKIYWIHQFGNYAKIGTMARPRGNEWLEEEIIGLKKQNVHVLVSLLESDEIYELGLTHQDKLCKKYSIDFYNFPIADRGLPDKNSNIEVFISRLYEKIKEGRNLVIHCRMGIGRSSMIAGSLLLKERFKVEDIISQITKIRGLKVPDTNDQLKWLKAREVFYQ